MNPKPILKQKNQIEPVKAVEHAKPVEPVKPRRQVFWVKPDIQNDIYHLYSVTKDNCWMGLACIPDYKTSVMMNRLFRNIKENENLDALEESDDEEEFQNCQLDKFVFLDKSYKMVCQFHSRFKKWCPLFVA
jgi:hypothetical protein